MSSGAPPASPLDAELLAELRQLVPSDALLTAPEDLIPYAFDGTAAHRARPAAVVIPTDRDQLIAVVRAALRREVPIVTRGNGTGLSAGSLPSTGSLVVCLNRLDRILELDPANLTMMVEPGVVTQTISSAAEAADLFYPPDPGSMKISTIGGNVAENSGGLRGLKYGVTRDYVMGLEVILADGSVCWLGGKCVKDVAGFSLRDLFIGSEGTLGVITKILLKLVPKPAARRTLLATFASMEDAASAVSGIIAAKVVPCTLEFLDQKTIRCVEDFAHVGLPVSAGALLLIEADGNPAAVDAEIAVVEATCRAHHATDIRAAADAAEATRLATARRSAFSALARMRPTTILEDVTVPRSELARMVRFIETVATKHDLQIATFGHFGDGNLHPTFLTDERDEAEMVRVHTAMQEIVTMTLELGGTITGEHGVGLAKREFLPQQLGDASYQLHRQIKRTLDPAGLFNPGKVLAP
ncbi:FAD-binding oxidoreductase [Actomonas aquatica]|uniref:FAD-linked oxidase C-terminal domain-containing protein n=1 Tax=Actomonas aquatica TaxID=2866162 RepID=A0ABZ1CEY2_9BACT|nr:FAD-linked oxidase C-terminal domain-containing protein [Opitutus sp. WL0086]WRQ90094.1 FAD-linked oxidase C-terminal domain-containing protein [Opitutus sp. WL0086]